MTTLGRQYLLGAGYDAIFLKDRYMQDLFSRMIKSTSFYYLAEACNPRVHRRIELTAEDVSRFGCDVGIACTLYYYRQEILQQLREFDLKLWGTVPDWLLYRLCRAPQGARNLHGRQSSRRIWRSHLFEYITFCRNQRPEFACLRTRRLWGLSNRHFPARA